MQDNGLHGEVTDLRKQAEQRLPGGSSNREPVSTLVPQDVERLVHELQVHQIELEIQNEELRRAHRDLEQSRDKYAHLYDFAPCGYATLDHKGLIKEVNLTACSLLGVDRPSLLNLPLSRFLAREDADTYYFHIQQALASRNRQTCEVRLRRENGNFFQSRLESVPVTDPRGEPLGVRTVLTDITDRRNAEQNYQKAAELLKALFEASPDLISVHDRDLRIVMSNWKGHEHIPLEKRKEGLYCYDVYMNRSIPCENCVTLSVFETGEPLVFEHVNPVDGTIGEVSLFPIHDETGDVAFVAKNLHDITDRRRSDEAVRESEERFRAVFEGAGECIFIHDTDLRYTHVNQAVTKLFGIPAFEIVGRRAEEIYGTEIGMQISGRSSRVLAGETLQYQQTRSIKGVPMVFQDVSVPLRNTEDEIVGVCCISRQITETDPSLEKSLLYSENSPSSAMQDTLKKARAAAVRGGIVLLQGESGSGKDYLARWIHDHSPRCTGPFFSINCAALPKELAESELFGHERGAFTGAVVRKKGMLELAEGGTILLNEIGELVPSLQAKLLIFLDTNSFMRVGGEKSIRIDARLVAATHRDLREEVSQGRFLEPLFYRLNVFPIDVPPLRERLEDIPILVDEIVPKLEREIQLGRLPIIDDEHIEALSQYHWPGNVRELRNVLERSLMLWRRGRFKIVLPEPKKEHVDEARSVRYIPGKTLKEAHQEITRSFCHGALRHCRGNKRDAAKLLGISRDAFYRYIKRFGI